MALYYLTYYKPLKLQGWYFDISPAGQQKSEYIVEQLSKNTNYCTIINLAETSKKWGFVSKKHFTLFKNIEYIIWRGFGKPNGLARKAHYYFRRMQLKHFLNSLTKDDVVIAYHSLITADIYTKTIRKRKYKLILELEEIYQDVVNCGKRKAFWERQVINSADGFILSTKALKREIPTSKPFIICNGTYHIEPNMGSSFEDNKVHCVYAGTFDPIKGGAAAAAAAAEFLPEKYHIHILGFGTAEQKDNIKTLVENIQKKAKCIITYDGLKSGKDFVSFIQKCHIGLCTQIPDSKYAETSFPSKILVYLANGLRVLSVRVSVVEQSSVGELLHYYDNQTPQDIAVAITQIDVAQQYDSRERLKELDNAFGHELHELIESVQHEIKSTI